MKSKIFREKFTLLELLIVIAIIMILASMLLPGLKSTRETAKKIRCAANMKQIATGLNEYNLDFNGYLPPTSPLGNTGSIQWTYSLKDYFSIKDRDFYSIAGAFKGYPRISAGNNIFFCLSSRFWETPTTGEWGLSYGPAICATDEPDSYNPPRWGGLTYCRDGNAGSLLGYTIPKKFIKVPNGSVLVNEQYRDRYGKCCSDNGYSFPSLTNDITIMLRASTDFCHNRAANFLFMDSHVESLKLGTQFDNNWIKK